MSDIQALFTEISPSYDRLNHLLSLGQDLRWRKKSIALLPWPKEARIRVLDLCAGTLDFGLILSKKYPHSEVHSLDFSFAMLQAGRHKIPYRLKNKYPLYCADARALPFRDTSFDLVLCAYGMRNIPDQERALQEIARVLKPKGLVAILDFFKPAHLISTFFYNTYGAYILPLVGSWISGNRDAYAYLNRSIQNHYTLKNYINFLTTFKIKIFKVHNVIFRISGLILGTKE